jgi:hypothetical protein
MYSGPRGRGSSAVAALALGCPRLLQGVGVAEAVELPLMVDNWARGTNVESTWEVAAELAKVDRIR